MPRFGLLYGFTTSLIAAATGIYGILFIADLAPKSVDSGVQGTWPKALVIDGILLGLFAVQHSVMARQGFKRWWTRLIPPSIERSTYVLISCLFLAILFWLWRPITYSIWTVEHVAVRSVVLIVFWLGWLMVFIAGFRSNYLQQIGLQQVMDAASGGPVT